MQGQQSYLNKTVTKQVRIQTKLFESEREAFSWIADQDHRATRGTTYEDWDVIQRPVERRRCEGNWCNVAEFCEQFKKYKESKDGN